MSPYRKLAVISWLCLGFFAAGAQYRFDSWTTENGLPQNSIYSIAQSPDGYLWFTTLDGLVRFDGVRFTVFNKSNQKNLKSNRLVKLLAEADNTLWIGTVETGLIRYRNGEFKPFSTAEGLLSNRVYEIQKDTDGSLLITTENGLNRWRNESISTERAENVRNYKVYLAPSGIRWEIDAGGIHAISTDGSRKQYPLPFDPETISDDRTYNYFSYVAVFEDSGGALWFSAGRRLFRLKDGMIRAFGAENGLPPSLGRVIAEDRDHAIWIGTDQQGACRLSGDRFDCFDTSKGLSSNRIYDIFSDREGTLWIGTYERGINRLTSRTVSSLSTAEGLPDKNVYPLLEDRAGGVWIGSFSALSYYKNGKITNYTQKEGLLYYVVQSLYEEDNGRLWIGSVGGVEYFENGKFHDFTEKLGTKVGDNDFWDIFKDDQGTLWFATNKGLFRYRDGTAAHYTTADGLPNDDVKKIHQARDGTLWLGTYSGLAELNRAGGGNPFLRNFTEADGLAGNHIRTIYEDDDGALWLGTYDSGLSRFKNGRFTNFGTDQGLYSNGVFQILPDARGNFWMSSNQGIYRISRQMLDDFADGRIPAFLSTVFGRSDGMLNIECNGGRQPAGIKTRDGKLWFPTQDGVAIIDPEKIGFNPLAPPVVIESAALENSPVAISDQLTIEPNQGNLVIRYTGLSFIKPEYVQFRYKLEGLDENWTNAGTRREAYYPYLPPGNYTFRVIAANSDNVWNEQGAEIRIVVRRPFYRQWWFVTGAVLVAAGIVFQLYRRRIVQLQKKREAQRTFSRQLIASQEQERKRIAAELHDSLGQRLVVIKNLALIFLNLKKIDAADAVQIEEISAEASRAIGEVKEISYNLRPYQLDRIGLTKAIEAIVRTTQVSSEIEFSSKIDDIDSYFPKETEINFYRIVQECVNNTVKHSAATKASVEIRQTGDQLEFEVRDNGRGFSPDRPASQTGGFGLIGLTERVELLGGKIEIKSSPERGTTVKIQLNNRDFGSRIS